MQVLTFHLNPDIFKTILMLCKYENNSSHKCTCLISHFSRSVVSDSLQPHGLQHARLPCPSPTPRPCSNSWLLMSQWCHSTISSSVISFSSCLQSFPASGSFNMLILHMCDTYFQPLLIQALETSAKSLRSNYFVWDFFSQTGSKSCNN